MMDIEIVHALPGRIRFRIRGIKSDPGRAAEIEQQLTGRPGVRQVRTNPTTGSLLLHFDPQQQDSVLSTLSDVFPSLDSGDVQRRLVPSSNGSASTILEAGDVARFFDRADKKVKASTGVIDLRLLVPLLLTMMAAGSLILAALRRRAVPIPSWYDLIWFAFNTFIILNLVHRGGEETEAESP
jgi:hypothetical protein